MDEFNALSVALREAGRAPSLLPTVERAAYRLDGMAAAPRIKIGADVLPWWPAKGVYVLVERGDGARPGPRRRPRCRWCLVGRGRAARSSVLHQGQQRAAHRLSLPRRRAARRRPAAPGPAPPALVGERGRAAAGRAVPQPRGLRLGSLLPLKPRRRLRSVNRSRGARAATRRPTGPLPPARACVQRVGEHLDADRCDRTGRPQIGQEGVQVQFAVARQQPLVQRRLERVGLGDGGRVAQLDAEDGRARDGAQELAVGPAPEVVPGVDRETAVGAVGGAAPPARPSPGRGSATRAGTRGAPRARARPPGRTARRRPPPRRPGTTCPRRRRPR